MHVTITIAELVQYVVFLLFWVPVHTVIAWQNFMDGESYMFNKVGALTSVSVFT